MGTLHDDLSKIVITRSVLLKMRIFQSKFVEKFKIHVIFNNFFRNRAVFGILFFF